jgi:peptidyl-prolyl cis-trans isomerase C
MGGNCPAAAIQGRHSGVKLKETAMLQSQEQPTLMEILFPPMAFRSFVYCILLALAYPVMGRPQTPVAPAAGDPVVIIDGVGYSAADIARIRAALPPQFQQTAMKFSNREFVEQYRRFLAMAKMAEKEGIAEKEPFRTQLENYRMLYLAQVYTTELSRAATATDEEIRAYYDKDPSDYDEVRVSAIYIDYNPNAAPGTDGSLSEQEALAKTEELKARILGGADFAEVARESSDDKDSAAKGGDLGYFKADASLPPAMRTAIFSLQAGDLSAPVKDGGRFYLFKATERRSQPFDKVEQAVANKVRGLKFIEKAKQVSESIEVEYKDEAYFADKPAQPSQPTITVTPRNAE